MRANSKKWLNERRVLDIGTIVGVLITIYLIYYQLHSYIVSRIRKLTWIELGYDKIIKTVIGYGSFILVGIITYRIIYKKTQRISLSIFGSILCAFIANNIIYIFIAPHEQPDVALAYIGFLMTIGIIYISFILLLSFSLYLSRRGERNEK